MKNLICLLAFVFAVVFQSNATNTPNNHTSLNVIEHQKAVILNLAEIEASSFVIFDKNGANVFSQEIEAFDNGIKYVMSNLPIGQYTIKIQGDDFVDMYRTVITADSLKIESSETYLKPTVIQENDKIVVNADLANKEDILLYIYNQDGKLVYEYNEQKIGKYNRVFDLNQLEKGAYSVVVATDHFTETSKISL